MSYGTGPFGFAPFGAALPTPTEETRSSLSSSRKIDFVRGRYVANDEGGFEAMDDVAQTVTLLVAFTPQVGKFVTPQAIAFRRSSLFKALSVLTRKPKAVIAIKKIEITPNGRGGVDEIIIFQNLRTNTQQTVEAT